MLRLLLASSSGVHSISTWGWGFSSYSSFNDFTTTYHLFCSLSFSDWSGVIKTFWKADDRLLSFFALANTLCFCCMLLKHTLCLSSTFLPRRAILETSTSPTPILLVILRTTSLSWLIHSETSVLVDSGTSYKITLSLRLSISGVTRNMVIPGPVIEVVGDPSNGGLGAVPPDAENGLIFHVLRMAWNYSIWKSTLMNDLTCIYTNFTSPLTWILVPARNVTE